MSGEVQGKEAEPLQVAPQQQPEPQPQGELSPIASEGAMPAAQNNPEVQGQIAGQMNQITPEQIMQALIQYGGGQAPPVAQSANALSLLGNEMSARNPQIDPAFAAALALRESSGGRNIPEGSNNPYGIMSYADDGTRSLAQYPDFTTATLGGGPQDQQGLRGTLMGGKYDPYLESGNLEDFFNTYSPSSENAPIEDQVAQFMQLLQLFQR